MEECKGGISCSQISFMFLKSGVCFGAERIVHAKVMHSVLTRVL